MYCHEDGHGNETRGARDDNGSPGLIFPSLGGHRRGRRGGSRPYYGGRVSRGGGGGLGGYGPQVTKRNEEEGVGDDGRRRHRPASRPRAEGIGGNEMGHHRANSPRALRRCQHSLSVVGYISRRPERKGGIVTGLIPTPLCLISLKLEMKWKHIWVFLPRCIETFY